MSTPTLSAASSNPASPGGARPQRLGERLIAKGLISGEDLEKALEIQKDRGDKIGRILVDLGFVSLRDVLVTLAEQLQLELVTIQGEPPNAPELEGLNARFLRQARAIPFAVEDSTLVLAMADPLDFETIAAVHRFTGLRTRPALAVEAEILEAVERHYTDSRPQAATGGFEGEDADALADLEQLRDMASEAPVIRLVNSMIAQAVEKRASDIHIEPFEKEFRVRYRVDGVLYNQDSPPKDLKAAIISRLKLMARLNIAERRLPQDGRIKIKVLGREVDLRVSTLPTLYGESVVMRLLDRSAGDFYDLQRLGFDQQMLTRMHHFTSLPHGIFLVTGPTGSGKSTTLYSALKRINQPDKKIITIEDPVEYQMDGINQIFVNPQIGLDFATGLRHIVRQDPDVIMVGEIRDRETADIAIRAALTGHFVYSTLHTNDAPSAVTRLHDMGVQNYLMSSTVVAVLAQRLVRVLCKHCKREAGQIRSDIGKEITHFKGAGCQHCFGLGYSGRMGIFELMELNDRLRELIMQNANAVQLATVARELGMKTLREDGWFKVETGMTSAEEIIRVTQDL
ncbi:MAG: type II secretion system ATPase GspE [Bryobacterales bacterium]|nr:type II secretion system ATPase GspE [Bryobacterales bacterium]